MENKMTEDKIKKWAEAKLKEYQAQLQENYDDPSKTLDSIYVNGKQAVVAELLARLKAGVMDDTQDVDDK